jgi:shikimate dehydrogenase
MFGEGELDKKGFFMAQNKVGVIGWPVSHSLSPAMHNAAFQALGMTDWLYDLIPLPPDIVRQGLRTLRDEGGYIGVNVTVPHKQAVMPFVKADARALAIGAVNTIDFRENTGTNTDVIGFIDDLKAHGVEINGAKVLVLGAGGAARAAVYGLVLEGAKVTVVNRTVDKAQAMLADLTISAGIKSAVVKPLEDAAGENVDLVVNCTTVGMIPNVEACPWPDEVPFPQGVTVYDMVYRPEITTLMRKAEAQGGRAIGGLGMLVRQGAAAFQLWTGVEPPTEVMFAAARKILSAST